eukprot:5980890-Pyramimonas_sp.AAC.1
MRHRACLCSANEDSKAHVDSDKLVPVALTQGDSEACLWYRGLAPRHMTAAPAAPMQEKWTGVDLFQG